MRIAALVGLSLLTSRAAHADDTARRPELVNYQIRIAVVQGARAVAIKPTRDCSVWNSQSRPTVTLKAGFPYLIAPKGEGVELREMNGKPLARDSESLQFRSITADAAQFSVEEVESVKGWSPRTIDKARRYRGQIEIFGSSRGRLTVVNRVFLEHYLYGVIAPEIGADAPFEAMKALAVCARSEVVHKLEKDMTDGDSRFDFTDGTELMTYKGAGAETPQIVRAVDATRGEALVCNGQVIDAVFSDTCGGVISSSEDHWGANGADYSERLADRIKSREVGDLSNWRNAHTWTSRGDVDSMCNPNQPGFPSYAKGNFRWRRTFEGKTLSKMFDVGAVKDIVTEERTPSGRIRKVRIVGERRSVTITRELPIREAFGDLKSSFFTYTLTRDDAGRVAKMEIWGAGYGHGVGLCQMGAYMMAKRGYTYRQILGLYFCQVKIRKLYG